MLEEDNRLGEIEKELTERITKKDVESTKSEVKREVARLLRETGLSVRDQGQIDIPGHGEKKQVEKVHRSRPYQPDPLPTLPYPQVTRFEIVYPQDVCQIALNDTQSIVVETDADAAYDRYVQIRAEPAILEVASRATLRGGRIRWRLRPIQTATPGREGEIVATLTKPDGAQLCSKVLFGLTAPREKEARKTQGYIPPFEIRPITPEESEAWNALWPDDDDDVERQRTHAYKVLSTGGTVTVYYSTIFTPYKETVEKLKSIAPGRMSLFEMNYEIWIGYHAILQFQTTIEDEEGLNMETVELIQETERQTVARVQVRQALKTAELVERKAVGTELSM